jgi:hypothetical protein
MDLEELSHLLEIAPPRSVEEGVLLIPQAASQLLPAAGSAQACSLAHLTETLCRGATCFDETGYQLLC